MPCQINNNSNFDVSEIEDLLQDLHDYSQKRFGFKKPPVLNLLSDQNNTSPLGKTAHYDPNNMEITIYVDKRHPKDIMRSFSHELVHHNQNENGMFDNIQGNDGNGYAQSNPHLRKMEKEAYLKGNMCFRDWEDGYKSSNPNILNERRIHKMSIKDWKDKELNTLLNERWGFSMDLSKLNESKKKEYDLEEGHDRIFAPNHYCLHHVIYEGKEGKTVDHNWNEELQKVTRYDVKFEDGSIIRNIHESKLTVLEAFTEADHGGKKDDGHPPAKRDEKKMPMHDHDDDPSTPEVPAFVSKEEDAASKKKGKKGPQPRHLAAYQAKQAKNEEMNEADEGKKDFGPKTDMSKLSPEEEKKFLDTITIEKLRAALKRREKEK